MCLFPSLYSQLPVLFLSQDDILESLECPGPLVAMLFFAICLILLFPTSDGGKSSSSFKITFGSTGFQQRVITVSRTPINPAL